MTSETGPTQVFDPHLMRARLQRARRRGDSNFLISGLIDDLAERLRYIRREFSNVLDVGTPADIRPQLRFLFPAGEITRLTPVADAETTGNIVASIIMDEKFPAFSASFDLAVSLLAFQVTNDLPGLLIQTNRALKPDGLLLAAMLGGQTLRELRTAFTIAESEITGGASLHVAPFADVRDMGALLQRAGFALPVADAETLTVRYADPFRLLVDLRAMGGTNAMTQRLRKPMRRAVLLRAMEIYRRDYSDPDGRVRATFEIIWLSGWRPHESQQKPLKPGSAIARLADVLPTKTYE